MSSIKLEFYNNTTYLLLRESYSKKNHYPSAPKWIEYSRLIPRYFAHGPYVDGAQILSAIFKDGCRIEDWRVSVYWITRRLPRIVKDNYTIIV